MQFKKAYPGFDRKLGTFLKMIPRNYKSLDLTCRRVCVCTKHYNLEQRVEALNNFANMKKLPELKTTLRKLSNITVCLFNDFPSRECVDRKCCMCGTEYIKTFYHELEQNTTENDTLKYHQWEAIPEQYTNKLGKKVESKRWVQSAKAENPKKIIDSIASTMESFTAHQFRADFQHKIE